MEIGHLPPEDSNASAGPTKLSSRSSPRRAPPPPPEALNNTSAGDWGDNGHNNDCYDEANSGLIGNKTATSLNSVKSAGSARSGKSTARTEALYLHSKVKEVKMHEKKKQEDARYQYKPNLIQSKVAVNTTFEERQRSVQEKRQQNVQRHHDMERTIVTHRPNLGSTAGINSKVRAALNGDQPRPVYESLHLLSLERQERARENEKKVLREHTFTPNFFTRGSKANLAVEARSEIPVHARLFDLEHQQKQVMRVKQMKDQMEVENCTFSPTLVTKTYTRPTTSGEPQEQAPVHERLFATSDKHRQNREQKKAALDQQALEGLTFSPQINDTQKLLTRTPSQKDLTVHERLHLNASEKRQRAQLLENMARAEATFQPKLNANRIARGREGEPRSEQLYQLGVQKQARRKPVRARRGSGSVLLKADGLITGKALDDTAHLRAAAEEAELALCTFRPNLAKGGRLPPPPPPEGEVAPRGRSAPPATRRRPAAAAAAAVSYPALGKARSPKPGGGGAQSASPKPRAAPRSAPRPKAQASSARSAPPESGATPRAGTKPASPKAGATPRAAAARSASPKARATPQPQPAPALPGPDRVEVEPEPQTSQRFEQEVVGLPGSDASFDGDQVDNQEPVWEPEEEPAYAQGQGQEVAVDPEQFTDDDADQQGHGEVQDGLISDEEVGNGSNMDVNYYNEALAQSEDENSFAQSVDEEDSSAASHLDEPTDTDVVPSSEPGGPTDVGEPSGSEDEMAPSRTVPDESAPPPVPVRRKSTTSPAKIDSFSFPPSSSKNPVRKESKIPSPKTSSKNPVRSKESNIPSPKTSSKNPVISNAGSSSPQLQMLLNRIESARQTIDSI